MTACCRALASGLTALFSTWLIIAEEEPPGENVTRLTAQILEAYPNLPIIRVTLARNEMRIYTSQTLPARSADLIDLIRHLPALTGGGT